MTNDEQVRRNEQYLRQTEARDYERFAGLEEGPEEEKAGLSAPPLTLHKEHTMFLQNMQQERTWQTASAEIITHIMKLHNVDAEKARSLYRTALDTLGVWTLIMEEVAEMVEGGRHE